ncbi:MAG: type II toxin-antitoxin system mRNA interferase toxin, RelE/StbE family, partial [Anaerolineales bacterium]|nr:type II toxin-antitoxin system mRNA interferase toxin, RelE/StbE family [Anaerolineales bacterium]
QKITDVVYPQLRSNPYFGANIKKLKGEFEGCYRYRIGNYRLFYLIDDKKVFVFVIDLKPRKDAYK